MRGCRGEEEGDVVGGDGGVCFGWGLACGGLTDECGNVRRQMQAEGANFE